MKKTFILVAEDDADDRFLLQSAFEEIGYTDKIEFVENGVELLKFLHDITERSLHDRHFPGFILLDLNMPKKDGHQALKEIKSHPVYKTIPVVIYTTTKNDEEINRCYELGANTYIVKPARFESLLQVIEITRTYWFNVASLPR